MNMQVGRVWTAPPPAGEGQGPAQSQRASRRLYLPTIVIAGLAAWLSWRGWTALGQTGVGRSFNAGRYQLAGPVVLGFVLTVCVLEQVFPAQRRPLLARGHLLDFCYAVFYALLVIPLVVLLGAGFSDLLAGLAPWLVLPRVPGVPGWCFVALAVLGIDAVDWLTHLANHRLTALWRLHAVHHSQEELSILTTYRAHPLVHVSFLLSAIPVLAVADNTATPAVVLTAYACLGALPHANVRWTYGKTRPDLHQPRLPPHPPLGDRAAGHQPRHRLRGLGRALPPGGVPRQRDSTVIETGLSGRPIPVEQAGQKPRLGRTMLTQLAEPFTSIRTESQ